MSLAFVGLTYFACNLVCLFTLNHHFSFFFSCAITAHHGIMNHHLKESIIHCYSSIKFSINLNFVADSLWEDLLQIIHFQLKFSSFQWLSSILVLETHVDTKKVKCFVHLANNCFSLHPV